jgi:hypothetical protein
VRSRFAVLAVMAVLVLFASLALGVSQARAISYAAHVDYGMGANPRCVAVADFNGDGKQDLATSNWGFFQGTTASIRLGNGDGTFAASTDYGVGRGPYAVAAGDLNGDGKVDLAVANDTGNSISVLLGNGDGTFAASVDYGVGSSCYSVAIGDLNGDGKADLAATAYWSGRVAVLLGNGDGTFTAAAGCATGAGPLSVAIGDLTNDGKADLAVADCSGGTVSVMLGNGDGTFGTRTAFVVGAWPRSVVIADLDHDGAADLATADSGASCASVLLGNGDGTFGARTTLATESDPFCVAAGDLNGDGTPDLAVAADLDPGKVDVFVGNGDGTFAAKVAFASGPKPCWVAMGRFNGDAKGDLVTANYGSNDVSVLLGQYEKPYGSMSLDGGAAMADSRTVEIDSAVAEAARMRMRDAGGTWSAWQAYAASASWTVPADGTRTVEVEYDNPTGLSLALSDAIFVDTVMPSTTDNAPAAWQTSSPVNVTLTAGDGSGSGVASTEYKLDGAADWTTGTAVTVSGEAVHTLEYRSTDEAGNVETTRSVDVKIDMTAPTTTDDAPALWSNATVTFDLTPADPLSGIGGGAAKTEYSTDGGVTWTTGTTVTVTPDAVAHTTDALDVLYRSTDAAGNVEIAHGCVARLDTQRPVTLGGFICIERGAKAVFRFRVKDAVPGSPATSATSPVLIKIRSLGGTTVKVVRVPSPCATNARLRLTWARCTLPRGIYIYRVYATDQAGNRQSHAGGSALVVY